MKVSNPSVFYLPRSILLRIKEGAFKEQLLAAILLMINSFIQRLTGLDCFCWKVTKSSLPYHSCPPKCKTAGPWRSYRGGVLIQVVPSRNGSFRGVPSYHALTQNSNNSDEHDEGTETSLTDRYKSLWETSVCKGFRFSMGAREPRVWRMRQCNMA